jgi:small subunit ribosomal protein S16
MLKIRLQRVGRKHDPSFRVVLLDSRRGPRSGNVLEVLGSYDARKGAPQLKGERIKHWISKGAQVSDTLHNLLVSSGIVKGKKKDVRPKIKEKKGEEAAAEEKEGAEKTAEEKPVEKSTKDTEDEKEKEGEKPTEEKKEEENG